MSSALPGGRFAAVAAARRRPHTGGMVCRGTIAVLLAGALAAQDPAGLLAGDAAVRRAALERFAAAGTAAASHAPAVALRLTDEELAVRQAAVRALLALRPDLASARDRLAAIVAPPAGAVTATARWNAVVGLGGGRPAPQLGGPLQQLGSPDAGERARAVETICGLGEAASAHQDAVLALRADPDAGVRAAVARGAAALGWTAAARDALLDLLKDGQAFVRGSAAAGLGRADAGADAVAALRASLQDPDWTVRVQVLQALRACGESGRAAGAEVVSMVHDRAARVRVVALETVTAFALADERAVAAVARCLEDDDVEVLQAALRGATGMGPAAAGTFERVLVLSRTARAMVRQLALTAAARVAAGADRGRAALRLVEALREDVAIARHAEAELRSFCGTADEPPPPPR